MVEIKKFKCISGKKKVYFCEDTFWNEQINTTATKYEYFGHS